MVCELKDKSLKRLIKIHLLVSLIQDWFNLDALATHLVRKYLATFTSPCLDHLFELLAALLQARIEDLLAGDLKLQHPYHGAE